MRAAYLDSFAMRLPVAGGVISSLITNETWRGMSTVFEQPVRMAGRLAGAIHQGNEEKLVGAMADALSFLTKIPVSRVVRSGMRGYDQWQRGEGNTALAGDAESWKVGSLRAGETRPFLALDSTQRYVSTGRLIQRVDRFRGRVRHVIPRALWYDGLFLSLAVPLGGGTKTAFFTTFLYSTICFN